MTDLVESSHSAVLARMAELAYPDIERGEGVRLYTTEGREVLDACSGGAATACLGHGLPELVDAAARQAERLSYVYNHHFTNDRQEELGDRLISVAAPEMARVRLTSGGSEANEAALRLVRSYHVERGQPERWRIVSPAQAYHGATFGALSLTGRESLQRPYDPYLQPQLHIPPGDLDALDRVLDEHDGEIAAFFCEPVSAASLPAWSPPDSFWEGLAELRERHGFLVCFDEVVTGMGRTGSWFAYQQLPIEPDIVTAGKGLGGGYFPLSAVLCQQPVYDAIANGSREFEHGHTWDGAPLSCAVGLATLEYIESHGLLERVRERGPSLRDELEAAIGGFDLVGDVRGRGFLLGVELTADAAAMVDWRAFEHGLLVTSSHSSVDGFVPDQTLLAPAYTATDSELEEMLERFAKTLADVEERLP